jgi:hypothetical protein
VRQRSPSPAAAVAAGSAKVDDVAGVAELLDVGGLSSREADELRSLLLLHCFAEEVGKQGPGLTNRKGTPFAAVDCVWLVRETMFLHQRWLFQCQALDLKQGDACSISVGGLLKDIALLRRLASRGQG